MLSSRTAILTALVVAVAACVAAAETYKVSDLDTLARLVELEANPGDVIEIQPGTYFLKARKLSVMRSGTPEAPIVIRGIMEDGKRPVIDASQYNVMRGIFYFEMGVHDVILEDVELCNAAGGGREGKEQPRNAAGCYVLGNNITIRNCYLHHNENGLFSTRESDYVLIDGCDIGYNGRELGIGDRYRTHNFYFNSKHQMVIDTYIHHSTDSQNFKSRGYNTIFAFNRVEEELAYSMGLDSNNEGGTLWLGNVAVKRTYDGINQGRLLGVGDGTGVARGTLVAANNTFITSFPRDFYLFTYKSSTTDVVLINNVFAGPGEVFLEKGGQGKITGSHNWIQKGIQDIPDTLENTILGEDAGFVDAAAFDFRLKSGSALANAGASAEAYAAAVKVVLDNATTGTESEPSPEYLKALEKVSAALPAWSPVTREVVSSPRQVEGGIDIGAYELTVK